jgi:hypothetical protein
MSTDRANARQATPIPTFPLQRGKELWSKEMERKKVNASNMRSVGYDANAQVLEIEFSDGKIVQYSRISSEVHRRLMASPSMKSFFDDNIEDTYSAKRIR